MARIAIILGWIVGLALGAEVVAQNIPPPNQPYPHESSEPPVADPKHIPEPTKPEVLLPAPLPRGGPPPTAVRPNAPIGPTASGEFDPPTPAVSVRVEAPASATPGQELEYKIRVENRTRGAAHHVLVSNALPRNATFVRADPVPTEATPAVVRWKIGTLEPGARKVITMIVRPDGAEDLTNVARVQFEHGQQVNTRIVRPNLQVKVDGPTAAVVNEPLTYRMEVTNASAVDVADVVASASAPEGMDLDAEPNGNPRERSWTVGPLKAGQKKQIEYKMTAKRSGVLTSRASASARGGAKAETNWTVTTGEAKVDIKMTGPAQQYINQVATYRIELRNTGTIPLDNVTVANPLPAGLKVARASNGADLIAGRMQWIIRQLKVGETRVLHIGITANEPGRRKNIVTALGRGFQQHANTETEFLGAALMSLDVRESDDPVEVGKEVTYTINARNSGNVSATNVMIQARLNPELMQFVGASEGYRTQAEHVMFGPLQLKPGEGWRGTVTVRAVREGDARFHAELKAEQLTGGAVIEEQSTTFYLP